MEIRNTKELKKHNKYIVLNEIIKEQPVSRRDLSSKLDVSHATVSYICKELIEDGLIEETKSLESTGGRPPKVLEFKGEKKFSLIIELSYQKINYAIYDLNLKLLQKNSFDICYSAAECIKIVSQKIKADIKKSEIKLNDFIGILISIPGIYNDNTGLLEDTNLEMWNEFPLVEIINKYFDLPIYVENDANVFAYFESNINKNQKEKENILYIYISGGIGSALIIDGELYKGSHGRAGEIGHIKVTDKNYICSCGQKGCLEAVASMNAIYNRFLNISKKDKSHFSINDFINLYNDGNELANEIIEEAVDFLTAAIKGLVDFLDPDSIIIGDLYNIYDSKMINIIKQKLLNKYDNDVNITARTEGENIELKAAAKYILDCWKLTI